MSGMGRIVLSWKYSANLPTLSFSYSSEVLDSCLHVGAELMTGDCGSDSLVSLIDVEAEAVNEAGGRGLVSFYPVIPVPL